MRGACQQSDREATSTAACAWWAIGQLDLVRVAEPGTCGHIFATVLISVYAAAAKYRRLRQPYLERSFRFFRGRAVLLQPVTVFLRSVDREYSVVDLLELAETRLRSRSSKYFGSEHLAGDLRHL